MMSEAELGNLYLESEITTRYYRLLRDKYATRKSRLTFIITILIAIAVFIIIFKLILPSSNIAAFINNFSIASLQIIVFNNIQSNLVWIVSTIALFYPVTFLIKGKDKAIKNLSVATRIYIAWNRACTQYEKLYVRCQNNEHIEQQEADKIELSLKPLEVSIDKTFPIQDRRLRMKAEKEIAKLLPHLYHG